MNRMKRAKQGGSTTSGPSARAGFTIIELLIATAVFAIVLLVVVTGVLAFSRQYYKGVISSNTQNAARAIIDDVTRGIQFGGGAVAPLYSTPGNDKTPVVGYCIGTTKRYSFNQDSEISSTSPHAVVSDAFTGCAAGAPTLNISGAVPANAKELLGSHMRISKFEIIPVTGASGLYDVKVRVVYGDDDLLCDPKITGTAAGSCDSNAQDANLDGSTFKNSRTGVNSGPSEDLQCRSIVGSQFCAVSELSTTVQSRV